MRKTLATICTIIALSVPMPAEAILGAGSCVEKLPVKVETRRGDTLIGLAQMYYDGNSSRYKDIAKHNGIKDPNYIRTGQVLELPGKTYEHTRPVSVADMPVGGYCRLY